jgi:hypothetical protein
MTVENPGPDMTAPAVPPAATGGASMMARLGVNEQLVLAGGAAVVLANVLGVVTSDWLIDLRFWLVVLGGLAAIAMVLMKSSAIAGIPGASWLRIDAAIVGAFALIDLGDTISSLGDWTTVTIVLTVIEVIGAAILVYGGWAASGGSITSDAAGVGGVMGMEMTDRFVYLGAAGVIAGWFILMAIADLYIFNFLPQVGVLAAVLVLAGRWLNRNPGAGALPVPYGYIVLGLGGLAVLVGLWWLINVIGRTFEVGDLTTWIPLLIYVLALVSLGLGAFMSLGTTAPKAPPPIA